MGLLYHTDEYTDIHQCIMSVFISVLCQYSSAHCVDIHQRNAAVLVEATYSPDRDLSYRPNSFTRSPTRSDLEGLGKLTVWRADFRQPKEITDLSSPPA